MDTWVPQYESFIQSYSEMCEGISSGRVESDSAMNDLYVRVENLELENKALRDKQYKSEEIITDLQCRSMRDNHLFTGISAPDLADEYEDVEETLSYFLRIEMKIEQPILFHRVHRIGQIRPEGDAPRPVVAKFEKYKDREIVRAAAPKTLRNTEFGVREQFPKSVEIKRRKLYPEMKRARENPDNKIRLVRDKLYVNGREFIPDDDETANKTHAYQNYTYNERGGSRAGSQPNYGTRIFRRGQRQQRDMSQIQNFVNNKSSVHSQPKHWNFKSVPPMMQTPRPNANRSVNFDIPNGRRSESFATGVNLKRNTPGAGKHLASSPADGDLSLKKHREHSDETSSEDSDLEIVVPKSPQSDPPNDSNISKSMPAQQQIDLHVNLSDKESTAQKTAGSIYLDTGIVYSRALHGEI